MNSTHPKLIFTIVLAISLLAFIGVTSLCTALFIHSYADPSILTALITITSGLIGSLTALLSNTRSTPPATDTTTTTTATTAAVAPPTDPANVIITNTPDNPVLTEDAGAAAKPVVEPKS